VQCTVKGIRFTIGYLRVIFAGDAIKWRLRLMSKGTRDKAGEINRTKVCLPDDERFLFQFPAAVTAVHIRIAFAAR
jgi:hypothetical protein